MYRGTTPTIAFVIKSVLDLTTVTDIWVTIKNGKYEKTFKMSDGSVELSPTDKRVSISLTQEDTLEFTEGAVRIQLKFLTDSDKVYASPIVITEMKQVLNEEIMVNE